MIEGFIPLLSLIKKYPKAFLETLELSSAEEIFETLTKV
jgi:hypothetical protein